MKIIAALATSAALALVATTASAQDAALPSNPADAADMQCVALAAMIMGSDEALAPQIAPAFFYYLGRLEGRSPDVDWVTRAAEYSGTLTPETLAPVQQRCGAEMTAKGQDLVAKGEAFNRRGA